MTATPFETRVAEEGIRLRRRSLSVLQINVGKVCNQACRHCHVDASPVRTEQMSTETADAILAFAERTRPRTLDITGGAPELNPEFRRLVTGARALGAHVIDRCNLTILSEPGQEDLAAFLAEHRVEVVASMPCYLEDNVDKQRGKGVFTRSIDGLRTLNALGYGKEGTGLVLNLVYNPVGAHLPPSQAGLEADYKRILAERYGVLFNGLYTITNMPIARFATDLRRQGQLEAYHQLLVESFNPTALGGLMCLDQVSVGWQGHVYDCDFNQMLGMRLDDAGAPLHISSLDAASLLDRDIVLADHCYGCTAGAGSSCGGALT
jgi:radical SAM/Cys-rich protein